MTKNDTNPRNNKPSSRKRSRKQHDDDDDTGRKVVGEKDGRREDEEPTAISSTPSAPPSKRKKRKNKTQRSRSLNPEKPLAGMVLSVSILKDNTQKKSNSNSNSLDNENDNDNGTASSSSYNDVRQSCRDLGADVIDLVCKRVTLLVCTEAAVRQATQRVRKAIKRNKPLVSVAWVEECRTQGRVVDFEEYRLDKQAENAIQNRQDRLDEEDSGFEAIPDSGWSEPKDLG